MTDRRKLGDESGELLQSDPRRRLPAHPPRRLNRAGPPATRPPETPIDGADWISLDSLLSVKSQGSNYRLNAKKGGTEMRISLVADDQASPVVRRIYQALEQRSGSVAPYFRVLAHKPDVLRAFNQLHAAIWADGALAAKLKHLAYLRVSILDGCGF